MTGTWGCPLAEVEFTDVRPVPLLLGDELRRSVRRTFDQGNCAHPSRAVPSRHPGRLALREPAVLRRPVPALVSLGCACISSYDTFHRIYETNVFGVVAVTNAFLPALGRSAHPRIVNISSGTGSLAWATGPQFPHRGTYAAYRSSKAALNALTVYYAHALADDGIKMNALAPGPRRTNLNATAAASDGDPAEAAAGAVRLALLPDHRPSGEVFFSDGTPVAWEEAAPRSKCRCKI